MTAKELNRDIKRMYAKYVNLKNLVDASKIDNGEYFKRLETEVYPEYKRLYGADTSMEYANKDSLLILVRLNLRFHIIPFHQFGLFINK